MSADKIPISTEARAKVRLWKRQTLARFQRIDAVIASAAFRQASRDFTHKREVAGCGHCQSFGN